MFLLLNGLYDDNAWFSAAAGLTLILGAAYMLRMYRNVFFGETKNFSMEHGNLSARETWILLPLCAIVIATGIYPAMLLNISQSSVDSILQLFHQGSITAAQ